MNEAPTKELAELESAARRSSQLAAILVACGVALFLAATFFASSQLSQMESSLQTKKQEEGKLSVRVENLAKQEKSLKEQVQAQANLLAETSRSIEEKKLLLEEISAKTKANVPLGQPIIERIDSQVDKATAQEQIINRAVETARTSLLPRVYLHIADEGQRSLANEIQAFLAGHGWLAPGVQNVSGRGYIPDSIEVRYLRPEDKEKAQAVLQILKEQFHITNCRTSYTERGPRDRPGHIEIWFSKAVQRTP